MRTRAAVDIDLENVNSLNDPLEISFGNTASQLEKVLQFKLTSKLANLLANQSSYCWINR